MLRASASTADAIQAVRQVPPVRTTSTSTPDSAIPAPMPPNPQPTRYRHSCRNLLSIALDTITNTSAQVRPAMNRSANQAV
jgi:hypothetical protein